MSACAISILLALSLSTPMGGAQPLSLQHRSQAPAEAVPAASESDPAVGPGEGDGGATAEPDLEPDPNAAIADAQAARKADASAAAWEREGDELAAKGERAAAIAAYTEARARVDDDAKAQALDAKIDAAYAQPEGELPGTQVVEGETTSASGEAEQPDPAAALATGTTDAPVEREPITKQWYFWVTVVAIAASAGAITGIATKAAIDERKATRSGPAPMPAGAGGPVLVRF